MAWRICSGRFLCQDEAAVRVGCKLPYSNGHTEGKIKKKSSSSSSPFSPNLVESRSPNFA